MPLYSFAMYGAHSGCFKFSYMHRTNMITSEHIKLCMKRPFEPCFSARRTPTGRSARYSIYFNLKRRDSYA